MTSIPGRRASIGTAHAAPRPSPDRRRKLESRFSLAERVPHCGEHVVTLHWPVRVRCGAFSEVVRCSLKYDDCGHCEAAVQLGGGERHDLQTREGPRDALGASPLVDSRAYRLGQMRSNWNPGRASSELCADLCMTDSDGAEILNVEERGSPPQGPPGPADGLERTSGGRRGWVGEDRSGCARGRDCGRARESWRRLQREGNVSRQHAGVSPAASVRKRSRWVGGPRELTLVHTAL